MGSLRAESSGRGAKRSRKKTRHSSTEGEEGSTEEDTLCYEREDRFAESRIIGDVFLARRRIRRRPTLKITRVANEDTLRNMRVQHRTSILLQTHIGQTTEQAKAGMSGF